jgi:hypothetical protein
MDVHAACHDLSLYAVLINTKSWCSNWWYEHVDIDVWWVLININGFIYFCEVSGLAGISTVEVA